MRGNRGQRLAKDGRRYCEQAGQCGNPEKGETGQGWEMAGKEVVRSSVLFIEVSGLRLY